MTIHKQLEAAINNNDQEEAIRIIGELTDEQLLEDINELDTTALSEAISCNCGNVIKVLLDRLTNEQIISSGGLHNACYYGNDYALNVLFGRLTDEQLAIQYYNGGRTPLHCAMNGGTNNAITMLLNRLTDDKLIIQDKYENTPLHFINKCNLCDETVIFNLLERLPAEQLLVKNSSGWTPLHYACRWSRPNIVAKMIEMLTVDQLIVPDGVCGRTPLHHACIESRCDVVIMLLEKLSDEHLIIVTIGDGWTPLHYACVNASLNYQNESVCKKNIDIIITLLKRLKSEDRFIRDSAGQTPLDLAIKESKGEDIEEIAKLFQPRVKRA